MTRAPVRLPGPFDDPARAVAPATPTCCCCCCCLVTLTTASTMSAVHVHHVARSTSVERARRVWLTVGAALAFPVALVVTVTAASALRAPGIAALLLYPAALVGLYRGAGLPPELAWRPAARTALIACVAFVVELVSFGFLLYGQILAIPLPIVAGIALNRRLAEGRPGPPPDQPATGGRRPAWPPLGADAPGWSSPGPADPPPDEPPYGDESPR